MREAEARRSRAQVDGQKRVEEEARAVEEAQMEANDPISRLARQQQQHRGLAMPPTVPEMKDGQGAGQWGISGEAKGQGQGQGQGQDYDTEGGAITPNTFGPHLKRVSALEATARVHRRFGSNNQPVASAGSTGDGDGGDGRSRRGGDSELEKRLAAMPYNIHAEDMQDIQRHPAMDEFPDAASFLAYVGEGKRRERGGRKRGDEGGG